MQVLTKHVEQIEQDKSLQVNPWKCAPMLINVWMINGKFISKCSVISIDINSFSIFKFLSYGFPWKNDFINKNKCKKQYPQIRL